MIKFWKSAAKGKSGYPVRPPETQKIDTKLFCLENLEQNEDYVEVFQRKSRLSLKLCDVLNDKKVLKYFVQFMQSIGKIILIKCWIELDDFRMSVLNNSNEVKGDFISRTKSFDLDWNSQERTGGQILGTSSCKSNTLGSKQPRKMLPKTIYSSSSCQNLNENEYDFELLSESGNKYGTSNSTEAAVSLFKKYIALEATQPVELPDNVRKTVISNICNPQGQITEDCFKPVLDLLFERMENQHYSDFQKSSFYIKAQIDILTSGTLHLSDILHNETVLFYFTEYLEQESSSLLLEFMMAVMHFKDNLINGNSNPQQAQDDGIVIYEKYFSLQAFSPIGFPTDIRLKVESEICREGGPLHSCFDIPYQIVYKTLSNYVKSFLESEVYYKFLTEMVNSVDHTLSHHRSQSDCSSEFSISTQNTLLAMGDPTFYRKRRNHSVPDMTIDSNQLYNADSLWQRKRHDGLTLGRINSLGRFESKFEPDPDKKDRSVLKKMMSRFVPTSDSKVEEEMAWQIAHMIVKDVTDLTMAPPENYDN